MLGQCSLAAETARQSVSDEYLPTGVWRTFARSPDICRGGCQYECVDDVQDSKTGERLVGGRVVDACSGLTSEKLLRQFSKSQR